jgi:hypothetical protein
MHGAVRHNIGQGGDWSFFIPSMNAKGQKVIRDPHYPETELPLDETMFVLNNAYKNNFHAIFTSLNSLALGVDYRELIQFRKIVPEVVIVADDESLITARLINVAALNSDKARFAINFVLEFALKVQTYDNL